MYREIIGEDPTKLTIREFEPEDLPSDGIRVKVEYAAPKHGTELHSFFHGADPVYYDMETLCFMPTKPVPESEKKPRLHRPGNMWVGHVIEAGSGQTRFAVGDRVAGYGPFRTVQTVKADAPLIPGPGIISDVLPMTEEMSWKAALCYDPAQYALAGIRDAHLRLGDTCVVSGLGAIGMITAQMAKLAGAACVIVSDPIAKRREIALKNGADFAIDPLSEDAGLQMKRLTGNRGADVAIETSGTYPALAACLRGLVYGGTIAIVGWYGPDKGGFHLGHEAHMNNAHLVFARACSEPNPDVHSGWSWRRLNETCWNLLQNGRINCEEIIDPVVSFEEAGEAYRTYLIEKPAESVKLGVIF